MARSSFTCTVCGISVISSRNSVPPVAAANSPSVLATAPVKAPLTWPNSSDSISVSGTAPQFTETKGPLRRLDSQCSAWATSSLPVPLSPVIITVEPLSAVLRMVSNTSSILGLRPTKFSKPRSRRSWRLRAWFSSCSRRRSSALRTVSFSSSSLKGLVT